MTNNEFEGRTAVITGGSAGIGRAAARAFADRGAAVVVVGRDKSAGAETVNEIQEAGGSARFVQADVATPEGREHLLDETGPADILVNGAGTRPPLVPAVELTEADFDLTFDVNVKAAYFLSARYGAQMAARGSGVIVNVSSINATRTQPNFAAYNATKAALDALTRSFAEELGGAGVRVNSVSPGPTWTPFTLPWGDTVAALTSLNPIPGMAEPDQVAQAIVFLASDAADHITGVALPVDGGRLAILGG